MLKELKHRPTRSDGTLPGCCRGPSCTGCAQKRRSLLRTTSCQPSASAAGRPGRTSLMSTAPACQDGREGARLAAALKLDVSSNPDGTKRGHPRPCDTSAGLTISLRSLGAGARRASAMKPAGEGFRDLSLLAGATDLPRRGALPLPLKSSSRLGGCSEPDSEDEEEALKVSHGGSSLAGREELT
jgi:hypothetical protein